MTEEFKMTEYETELKNVWDHLYDDEMEPKHGHWAELYYVRLPDKSSTWARVRLAAQAWIAVHYDGYCELHRWHWFGKSNKQGGLNLSNQEDAEIYEAEQEVWNWLQEWGLVELKPIGPEDSEYFATEKLVPRKRPRIINE